METTIPNLSEVVIKLPLNFFTKKEIGFKFGTFAFANMCALFRSENKPEGIEFNEIDEVMKLKSGEAMVKLITGGAMAYAVLHNQKCIVTESLVNKWLTKMSAKDRDAFMDKINVAILNGKVMGKSVSELVDKKQVKKK